MNDLRALKPVGLLLALLAAVLLLLWLLISQGVTTFLVPAPDKAAEEFVRALAAHRYQAAGDLLTEDLRQQVGEDQLQALTRSIEQAQQGIENAHGRSNSVREQPGSASAEVEVQLASGKVQTIRFPLRQEHGLWKLASIEPLDQLVGK